MPAPKPFLSPLFEAGFEPEIATGWEYSETEKRVHGVERHGAIDFDASRGTPVLAAAGGLAIATFQEYQLRDGDEPRRHDGEPIWFGVGLVVQIWHKPGRYTQYAHLDSVEGGIPYYAPTSDERGDLMPTHLAAPVSEYGRSIRAKRVSAGERIGRAGMTGMGIGRRSYEDWSSGEAYTTYTGDHLHFCVLGRRSPQTRRAERWDPFNVYDSVESGRYPDRVADWPSLPGSLWIRWSASAHR
ncbi:MAG: hypothetical protein WD603_01245 [Patescibacteria group bacterium]